MQIRSKIASKKGNVIVLDDKKKYLVIDCRRLIPWLGELKGYLLTLKEVKNE